MKDKKLLKALDTYFRENEEIDGEEIIELIEKGIFDDLPEVNQTPYEIALSALDEALEIKAKKTKIEAIKKVLGEYPDCFMAYVRLAMIDDKNSLALLRKAVNIAEGIARKSPTDIESFEETLIFTDYLRSLKALADQYYRIGRFEDAMDAYELVISLDENDPMLIRNALIPLYALNGFDYEASQLIELFNYDNSTHMTFNRALINYRLHQYEDAYKYLLAGKKKNKYILKYFLDMGKIDWSCFYQSYNHGSKEEAIDYVFMTYHAWYKTRGLIDYIFDIQNEGKTDSLIVS